MVVDGQGNIWEMMHLLERKHGWRGRKKQHRYQVGPWDCMQQKLTLTNLSGKKDLLESK